MPNSSKEKISIVSLLESIPWGGSEELWTLIADAAIAEGDDVEAFVPHWPILPARLIALREKGVNLIERSHHQHRLPLAERIVNKLLRRPMWLEGQLKSSAPRCLVVNLATAFDVADHSEVGNYLADRQEPFFLIVQHNFEEPWSNACRLLAQKVFRRARGVFFVAKRNLEVLERQLACSIENAVLIQNPVGTGFEMVPSPPAQETARFACVARLDAKCKGHDVLFEALAQANWRDRRWVLTLYGEGRDEQYLRELAEHYGIAQRIEFAGQVADVSQVWQREELMILPSRTEGTPLALLEALVAGRPAVVADAGDSGVWIKPGVTGFVAAPGCLWSLSSALKNAWASRERWPEMGRAAHLDAIQRLDREPGKTVLSHIKSRMADKCSQHGSARTVMQLQNNSALV